ncbi:MAG: hypothetical protein PHH00_03820 [Candidatus Nanoarchaeia archaeon]|nr:hypothetical protein [Candidatus Nanoarchaeia archaeon]
MVGALIQRAAQAAEAQPAQKKAVQVSAVGAETVKAEVKQKPTEMKHLFMMRHGRSDGMEGIFESDRGILTARAGEIRQIVGTGSVYIVSSTAPPALASAQVMAAALGIGEFEQLPFLWAEREGPREGYYNDSRRSAVMKIIDERKQRAEGLVIVTHRMLMEEFHPYFMREGMGRKIKIAGIEADYARAAYYDITKKKFALLPK